MIPDPLPTPNPSPTPPIVNHIAFPLRVSGTRFIDASGKVVHLKGAIAVNKAWGWPSGPTGSKLDYMIEAGINYTEVRLGPQSAQGPDPEMSPENGLALVESSVIWAAAGGLVVGVDVIDGWVMKHDYNFFGWDCSTTAFRAIREQTEWAERVARRLGPHRNVIFLTSNEGFDCPHSTGSSKDWEFSIRDAIRRGSPGSLIGTNSHGGQIEKGFDFVARHQDTAFIYNIGRPVMVDETGPNLTCEDTLREARRARASGSSFHLWWGDVMDEPEFIQCMYKVGAL